MLHPGIPFHVHTAAGSPVSSATAPAPGSGSTTRTSTGTWCSTSPRSTSGTRRTSGSGPSARPVPSRRRPPQRAAGADRGRRRRRRRDDARPRAVETSLPGAVLRAARGRPRLAPPRRADHVLPVQGPGVVLVGRRGRAPAQGPGVELRGAAARRPARRRPGRVLGRAGRRVRRRRAAAAARRGDRRGAGRRVQGLSVWWGRASSRPPGAALASSRPSAPGGRATPARGDAHCSSRVLLRGLIRVGTALAVAIGSV